MAFFLMGLLLTMLFLLNSEKFLSEKNKRVANLIDYSFAADHHQSF